MKGKLKVSGCCRPSRPGLDAGPNGVPCQLCRISSAPPPSQRRAGRGPVGLSEQSLKGKPRTVWQAFEWYGQGGHREAFPGQAGMCDISAMTSEG